MLSFFAEQQLRDDIVERVQGYYETGRLHQANGLWWLDDDGVFRGVAAGEIRSRTWQQAFAQKCGLPIELAYLIDFYFKHLPPTKAPRWALECIAALPVGVDLHNVPYELLLYVLRRLSQRAPRAAPLRRVCKLCEVLCARHRIALSDLGKLHERAAPPWARDLITYAEFAMFERGRDDEAAGRYLRAALMAASRAPGQSMTAHARHLITLLRKSKRRTYAQDDPDGRCE
jgi:hypothetical protein